MSGQNYQKTIFFISLKALLKDWLPSYTHLRYVIKPSHKLIATAVPQRTLVINSRLSISAGYHSAPNFFLQFKEFEL